MLLYKVQCRGKCTPVIFAAIANTKQQPYITADNIEIYINEIFCILFIMAFTHGTLFLTMGICIVQKNQVIVHKQSSSRLSRQMACG